MGSRRRPMKNIKESNTSGAVGCKLGPNWDAKMEKWKSLERCE